MGSKYQPLERFFIRTPYLPMTELFEPDFRASFEKKLIDADPAFEEAIFIASPVLYDEMQKYKEGKIKNDKDKERIVLSLLRYYLRMSTRCTPFGLFAGCSMGGFAHETKISRDVHIGRNLKKHTRLDMNFLCAIIQDIEKDEQIRSKLRFFPNTTIYIIGDKARYVEYFYRNARRTHNISAVDVSEYLETILNEARKGKTIEELSTLIISDEVALEEAREFIVEVINAQLLVSEIQPFVTGNDLLEQLLTWLEKIDKDYPLLKILTEINDLLKNINDTPAGADTGLYRAILEKINETGTQYDPKFIFQTDLELVFSECKVNREKINEISEAMTILNKLTPRFEQSNLKAFAEKYNELYEDREMPLVHVLDPETGIGFPAGGGNGVPAPLVDGLVLSMRTDGMANMTMTNAGMFMLKKYHEALRLQKNEVTLSDEELKDFTANWDDLPQTISVMTELLGDKTYISSAGGASAANLLGRFSYMNPEFENYVKEIICHDEKGNSEAIHAEIVHLPESRIGNILFRPVLRKYEIPYLSASTMEEEFRIPLDDLYLSVKFGMIKLFSKKLKKEIIPRLSSAHNFSSNALPVYQFLCELQLQNLRSGLQFRWSQLYYNEGFLPRVSYKNIIIAPSMWIIKTTEVKKIIDSKTDEDILTNTKQWRTEKKIPRYVELADGDNELFVDLDNPLMIKMLTSVIKKRPSFQLQEFLHSNEKADVCDEKGRYYTNQIVLSFVKEKAEI